MARKKVETKEVPQPEQYIQEGGVEAHIIADMLRIESITAELREFKEVTKSRLDKLESWIIAIVGLTFTSLVTTVIALVMKLV